MITWIAINYIGFALAVTIAWLGYAYPLWVAVVALYLMPPFLARVTLLILGKPENNSPVPSKSAYAWWITTQLQVPFMRFSFLEELLRLVPGLYSFWLRLWGAKVGKFVFWSPKVLIADRPFVEIGDQAVLGYGAKMTSHLLTKDPKTLKLSLIFGEPKIGNRAIVGTMSAIAPGAMLGEGETLKATSALPPFYHFKNNQMFNESGIKQDAIFIMTHEEA
ncbi:MAG: hypothetical protein K2P81_13055 [Bacteriovoracaceae bacterium]|nr:hypothetical protein [Bacteriovoracaceae bacterium]